MLGLGLGLTNNRRGGGGDPAIASLAQVVGSTPRPVGNYSYFTELDGADAVELDIVARTLSTIRFSGTAWSVVGNALDVSAIGLSNSSGIVKLTSSKVVILDQANNLMRVYSWDGADWTPESTTAVTIALYPHGAYLEDNVIAVYNLASNSIIKYTYDGSTTLTPSGYSITTSGTYWGLAALSSTELFVHSTATDTIYVYEDTGSAWTLKDSTPVAAAAGAFFPSMFSSTQAIYFDSNTTARAAVYNGVDDISSQGASSTLTGLNTWPRSLFLVTVGGTKYLGYHSWGDADVRAASVTFA